ncbi:hypothetical protein [Halogeometricum sp. CBA1124]|uniref:hypothetical protein n=1 Tax=Halogeometricum sp. CBA1124 TaxID=2668071 RepID=UPI00142B887D|nr:hypothetical protein [Halogeometricum sp. CBA1124]MUV56605.1 hypothetical protein [Halogeometricum sp. CBA1124]
MSRPPTERSGGSERAKGDSVPDGERDDFVSSESIRVSSELRRESDSFGGDTEVRNEWRAVRADFEDIRRGQLQRALSKLESEGELSDEQRQTVERLSKSIVEGVLSTCRPSLAGDEGVDMSVEREVVELFEGEN